ncbi:MAG TPA: ketopantoate reductase family protein [Casimicrobiaceae bacterium]|nr:ketopantoate reductase family protein [Casimicrobiaceae bacterium]
MGFEMPKVVIVGGGAMGSLFGGLLTEGGLDVTLIDVWREHVDAINRSGLRMLGHGGDRLIRVKATLDPQSVSEADVVLFQCKAFANETAARSVRHLFRGETVAISFQNGLGSEETLQGILGEAHVLGGLTAQGAVVVEAGAIRNFGDLPTYIGEISGGLSERAVAIADAFTTHRLPTSASADIKKQKWQKLLGNASLGALSAATDMTSAEMVAVPELREVILRALDETAAVARACGVALAEAEKRAIFDKLTSVRDGGTGASKSSMAADVALRRRTEIDTIHGAVARLGREKGVPTPTIDAMIAIIKGLESKYMRPAGKQEQGR